MQSGEVEMSDRKVISRHLLSWQTFRSSRSVWKKKWLWNVFHLAFSNSLSPKMMLELASKQIAAWQNQWSIFTLKMPHSRTRFIFGWWEGWRHDWSNEMNGMLKITLLPLWPTESEKGPMRGPFKQKSPFGIRTKRNCSLPPYGKIQNPPTPR